MYVGHPYGITINPQAVIGENRNIHKGVTIGQENRGKRKGTPVIGDEVWIGINATIVKASDTQYQYYLQNKNYDSIITGTTVSANPSIETFSPVLGLMR